MIDRKGLDILKKASNRKDELEKDYESASDPLESAGEAYGGFGTGQQKKSNDQKTAARWFRNLLVLIAGLLVLMMLFVYFIDPFLYYRSQDHRYWLNSRYVTKGILEHEDYDTVIIGSSMVQNFRMQSFRDKLGYEPVKATIGAMNLTEMEMMHEIVRDRPEVERIILNLDLAEFTNDDQSVIFPAYQYDDNPWNDYKYLLGYETWMRFLPLDVVIDGMYQLGVKLPEKVEQKTRIDDLADWSDDAVFGSEVTWNYYQSLPKVPSGSSPEEIYEVMVSRFEAFMEQMQFQPDKEYQIIFPPYSALYWVQAAEEGTFDAELRFKRYIVQYFSDWDNVRMIDMQEIPEITDLDHYMDLVHFDPEIQEMIVDAIQSRSCDITAADVNERITATIDMARAFVKEEDARFSNPIPLLSE
ncbi:hypothetical protein [Diplocloster hominis]|uniref:hypothetical protein n=1 Tax=Diplocloster hominis TaxID=3079010 RepID=UPI0031BBA9C8